MDNPTNQPPKTTSRVTMWIVLIVVVIALGIGAYLLLNQGGTNTNNANTAISNTTANRNINSTGNTNTFTNTNQVANVNSGSNANATVNLNTAANSNTNTLANRNTNTASNTNVDTSGWKSYIDSKYGFTIMYPPSWEYRLYTDGYNSEGPYVIVFTTHRSTPERMPFVSIREHWSVNEEIEAINQIDPPYTKVTQQQDISIGSLPAKQLTYESTVGLTLQKIVVVKGTTAFMFNSVANDSDFAAVASTFIVTE